LDRGRRVSAVFFQLEGTLVRMRSNGIVLDAGGDVALMPGVRQKLQQLDCPIFILGRARGHLPAGVIERCVGRICKLRGEGVVDYAATIAADEGAGLPASIQELLNRHQLPPSQTLLVGDSLVAEQAASAVGLARFLWAWHYFSDSLAETIQVQ
jgi:hypothetical protein